MRKILSILVLGSALALGACATSPGTPTTPSAPLPTTGNAQIDQVVAQVQAGTRAACSFIPTVQTIASIFLSGNPIYATASGIVSAICNAVAPPVTASARRRASQPVVVIGGGAPPVKIEGDFVR